MGGRLVDFMNAEGLSGAPYVPLNANGEMQLTEEQKIAQQNEYQKQWEQFQKWKRMQEQTPTEPTPTATANNSSKSPPLTPSTKTKQTNV